MCVLTVSLSCKWSSCKPFHWLMWGWCRTKMYHWAAEDVSLVIRECEGGVCCISPDQVVQFSDCDNPFGCNCWPRRCLQHVIINNIVLLLESKVVHLGSMRLQPGRLYTTNTCFYQLLKMSVVWCRGSLSHCSNYMLLQSITQTLMSLNICLHSSFSHCYCPFF